MRISQIQQTLTQSGAKPIHTDRILRAWLSGRALDAGPRKHAAAKTLPLSVRAALPELETTLGRFAIPERQHPDTDGSTRLLVRLADGQTVESVLLPKKGVCVSTQLGCAVGCTFCMTGKSGLLRQLTSGEILAQVVLARRLRPETTLRRVVFMGMGEPAHNLENVCDAIDALGTWGGIGHKNLVVSSVGDPRLFPRLLAGRVKPALALSLHSAHHVTRRALLPRAPDLTPKALIDAGEAYARATGYPIQYQWTLLAGVNDSEEELAGITRLLHGKYAMLNLIPCNENPGQNHQRPTLPAIIAMTRRLNRAGILTRIRHSAGQEVEGGCGQLRARSVQVSDVRGQASGIKTEATPLRAIA
ncbi:putative RNA methyltransferase [Betaproteobacteria bacterium]|nr:putative RNA methyltransferase [Betaproteobacteria bacterium]GHU40364.1 putative RNA methyltransferase [Betaproteobacteria bacterium]